MKLRNFVDVAFATGTLFCLIKEILALIASNTERVYFYWGMTLFLILVHKWIAEEFRS